MNNVVYEFSSYHPALLQVIITVDRSLCSLQCICRDRTDPHQRGRNSSTGEIQRALWGKGAVWGHGPLRSEFVSFLMGVRGTAGWIQYKNTRWNPEDQPEHAAVITWAVHKRAFGCRNNQVKIKNNECRAQTLKPTAVVFQVSAQLGREHSVHRLFSCVYSFRNVPLFWMLKFKS